MQTGALFDLSGEVAVNATWSEDIYFSADGLPMDISDLDWRLTLRKCPAGYSDYGWAGWSNASADLTLSIDNGALAITEDTNGNPCVLSITDAPGFASCSGDYVADLASKDALGVVTLWAHGTITIRNSPVSWP